ncbi:MAG: peptidoglycan-binding protein LysM [Acidimicrobiia bacterium]|nr:peptidoglycan-binding protein LysM [Acidimicrobiia bacterium]
MGVFDFIKEAGAKIGIGESKEEKQAKAASASAERAAEMAKRIKERKARAGSAAQQKRLDESKKAVGLEKYVKDLGFEIDKLDIRFYDGMATIDGNVATQDIREKVILAVGNVEGVGQVQDNIVVAEDSAEAELHVVVSGDTLSAIAKEHYGDASKYPVIFEANRPMLKDPDLIYVGQVLRIPPAS